MQIKTALVVLVAPLWLVLSGCAVSQEQTQQVVAVLGQAVQAFAAANGQTAGAPIDTSIAGQLPGAVLQGNGQGAPAAASSNPFAPQPLTLQSGVTPNTSGQSLTSSGSAPENAFTLASTAGQIGTGKANDGRLTLTQYGGPTDRTPDANTRAGKGNRENQLRSSSLALSPNLIREYGLRGGEAIYVKTSRGNYFLGTYDDTTGNTRENNVIDVYDPTDRLGRDNFIASVPAGGWQLAIGPRNV